MFGPRNRNITDLQRLLECCVEWDDRAENTLQNSRDTRCWVDRRGLTGPLLLITSKRHMARGLEALSNALPSRALVPYPLPDGNSSADSSARRRISEYIKYLCTLVIVHLPRVIGAKWLYGQFTDGCPGARVGNLQIQRL